MYTMKLKFAFQIYCFNTYAQFHDILCQLQLLIIFFLVDMKLKYKKQKFNYRNTKEEK